MVTGNESINVKKRNGRGTEPLNIEKIHEMVEYACEDITGVSSSSPPYISFYKYEGSFGVGSQNINSADISLTSTSTNDNSINLNAALDL